MKKLDIPIHLEVYFDEEEDIKDEFYNTLQSPEFQTVIKPLGKLFQKLVLNEDIIINNHKRIYNSIISTDNLFNFIFSIKTNFEKDIINLGLNNKYKLINIIKNLKKRIKSSSKLIVTKNSEFHYIINIDKAKHKYFFRPYSLNKTINSWIELIKK